MTYRLRLLLMRLLLALWLLPAALAVPSTDLNLGLRGAQCYYIDTSTKRPAEISIGVSHYVFRQDKHPKDWEMPYIVFNYAAFANLFLPSAEEYADQYPSDKEALYAKVLDPKTKRFHIAFQEGTVAPEPSTFYSGAVDLTGRHIFNPKSLGFYCVYVAPPVVDHVRDLGISLVFRNSHGSLPHYDYYVYRNVLFAAVIGFAQFCYLLHYIIKFKVLSDYSNFDSILIISKSVILYVLFPLLLTLFLQAFVMFLENFFLLSSALNWFFNLANWGVLFVQDAFDTAWSAFVLLFAMGYGVMYDNLANLRRPLPPRQWKLFRIMVGVLLLFRFLSLLSLMLEQNNALFIVNNLWYRSPIALELHLRQKEGLLALFLHLCSALTAVSWFVASMYFYVRTRRTLAHFAPVSDVPAGDASEKNERIIQAFRRSINVIFVLPFVFALIGVFLMVYVLVKGNLASALEPPVEGSSMQLSAGRIANALLVLDPKVIAISHWMNWLYCFVGVLLIFALWIKDNNGLLVNERAERPPDELRFAVDSD